MAETKIARKNFQEACKDQNNPKKMETKIIYMDSQETQRSNWNWRS